MKKLFYLMLLCAAAIFTSCESNSVNDIVGNYTYTETGYFIIAGQTKKIDYTGTFTVSRISGNRIRFFGDFEGYGTLLSNNLLIIDPDTDDFTNEGIKYHYDNTYSDGDYYLRLGSMSWKQNSVVTATYNGQVFSGSIILFVSAQKK